MISTQFTRVSSAPISFDQHYAAKMEPEDRKRINEGLSDQKTMEQLSSSGKQAQQKWREAKAQREKEAARAAGAKQSSGRADGDQKP